MTSSTSTPGTKPLVSQVGGHAGVLATEDGSLVIKAALPLELEFYQKLQRGEGLEALRPFIPNFIGTLKLEGEIDEKKSEEEGTISIIPVDAPHKDEWSSLSINTPKSYGKSIKASELYDGISRFFPVGSIPSEDEDAPPNPSTSGLPLEILLPILYGIKEDIEEVRDVYSELEIRMVAGSLLIVYEADWVRALEGVKRLEEDADDEDDNDDDDDEDDESSKPGPPYVVKLIDFAHTRQAPGQGPDEGVLLGMKTLLGLIDRRITELEKK
ncbi:hypothetical protein H0H87_010334 [Tephrocybe sp. NHM501043]|nr:hypothetical protein H0H87_010334 [Tephrocybe sp. NHM501043]